eukprot:2406577-Prymnesium_polylepis.1
MPRTRNDVAHDARTPHPRQVRATRRRGARLHAAAAAAALRMRRARNARARRSNPHLDAPPLCRVRKAIALLARLPLLLATLHRV